MIALVRVCISSIARGIHCAPLFTYGTRYRGISNGILPLSNNVTPTPIIAHFIHEINVSQINLCNSNYYVYNNPSRSIICNTSSFNLLIEWSLYSLNQHWGLWIPYCHIYLLLLERLLIYKIWFPITMSLEIIALTTIRQILNNANRSCKKISEEMRQTTIIFHNTARTTILLQRKLPRHNANLDRKLQIFSGRQILLCARREIAVYKSYIVSNNASFTPMITTLWEKTTTYKRMTPRLWGVFK